MRSSLLYFFLVAPFIAGILFVYSFRSEMTAPPAISGLWNIRVENLEAPPFFCLPQTFKTENIPMVISQSGQYLNIIFQTEPNVSIKTMWKKESLHLTYKAESIKQLPPTCKEPLEAIFYAKYSETEATENTSSRIKLFQGYWSFPQCSACPLIPFTATKLNSMEKKKG